MDVEEPRVTLSTWIILLSRNMLLSEAVYVFLIPQILLLPVTATISDNISNEPSASLWICIRRAQQCAQAKLDAPKICVERMNVSSTYYPLAAFDRNRSSATNFVWLRNGFSTEVIVGLNVVSRKTDKCVELINSDAPKICVERMNVSSMYYPLAAFDRNRSSASNFVWLRNGFSTEVIVGEFVAHNFLGTTHASKSIYTVFHFNLLTSFQKIA
uniref:Peptidase S1 domain-containing protein n=1 Tax=Ascaris lumbricoides TaxID=6252 RepID=A0A0M3IXC4_ASCLU